MLNFLIDANIPYAQSAFASLGNIQTYRDRQPPAQALREADVLLVRSITQVNEALLHDSHVQFVGTATIGVEHIDQAYLQARNIGFASAPGCNANAVSEYVLSSLLALADSHGFELAEKTVGVIGHGNVGSRVAQKLSALGVSHVLHDPPRAALSNLDNYVNLDTVLASDIVTLHVPLVTDGIHPTQQLANREFFAQLAPEAIFINTSRGDVVDETALLGKLKSQPTFTAVLDVWQHEPRINLELLRYATIATPHIAGHSLEGKARGTEMLYQAVCAHFNLTPNWRVADELPVPTLQQLDFSSFVKFSDVLRIAALNCYDPRRDDAKLRQVLAVKEQSAFFDGLRKHYSIRREYDSLQIAWSAPDASQSRQLHNIGFNLK